jgi:hypothetical protein
LRNVFPDNLSEESLLGADSNNNLVDLGNVYHLHLHQYQITLLSNPLCNQLRLACYNQPNNQTVLG